jgi:endonuclease YncB( thermonuclease family)
LAAVTSERHRATVVRVLAGDSIQVVLALWFDEMPRLEDIGLRGIKLLDDPAKRLEAQHTLERFLPRGRAVNLDVIRIDAGWQRKYLARVGLVQDYGTHQQEVDVGRWMVEQKVAEEVGE